MRITRTVASRRSASEVFAYLSDFTTTTEWDPGTVKTTLLSGDGGVGTRYSNTSTFNGRQTHLVYEVIEFVPGELIRLRGENKTVTAIDTITVQAMFDGTRITYEADFTFKGVAAIAAPFLRGAFRKLGDEAASGLRKALAN